MKTFENHLPTRPRKKWDSIEQYVEYLRHFMAYKYVKRFVQGRSVLEIGCGTGYGANYLSQFASEIIARLTFQKNALRIVIISVKKKNWLFYKQVVLAFHLRMVQLM